jgi:hypothetical protein
MLLKNKVTNAHMSDTDTMASYLMKITTLRDQLLVIELKIIDKELVPIAKNGFSSCHGYFVQVVYVCEKLPIFEKLWDDFIQEETKLEIVSARV